MKLFNLAIDNFGITSNTRLDSFSNGLNFISGPSGSGKSTVRNFVRGILFGFDDDVLQSFIRHSGRPGSMDINVGRQSMKLVRNVNEVGVGPLEVIDQQISSPISASQIQNGIDDSTYTSVFNFSFEQPRSQIGRILHTFRHKLAVPAGRYGSVNRSAHEQWLVTREEKHQLLQTLTRRLENLRIRQTQLITEIENASNHSHRENLTIEQDIHQTEARLSDIRDLIGTWFAKCDALTRDIDELRRRIDLILADVKQVPLETRDSDELPVLYQRLDEIDQHLRRWRAVQNEVQTERLKIRDEMTATADVNIDSATHPFHNAQAILANLEAVVGETESHAKNWANANVELSSSIQRADSVVQNCSEMREYLYQLCRELGEQYKHVRHRTAVGELKQLRRCYHEMGESIKRLMKRRTTVLDRIRVMDAAGADAILRNEHQFCSCAQHEGYLEARRRFFGALPLANPEFQSSTANVTAERARLSELIAEQDVATATIRNLEAEIQTLQLRLSDLQNTLRSVDVVNADGLRRELQSVESDINDLIPQIEGTDAELRRPAPAIEQQPHRVIEDASSMLTRLTDSQLTSVWINESTGTDVNLANRSGSVLNLDAVSKSDQVLVCLALSLAAALEFARKNATTPICYDDLLENVDTTKVDNIVRVLDDACANGHQVIVFGQHVNSLAKYGMQVNGIHKSNPHETSLHSQGTNGVQFFQLTGQTIPSSLEVRSTQYNGAQNPVYETQYEHESSRIQSAVNSGTNYLRPARAFSDSQPSLDGVISNGADQGAYDQSKLLRTTDFFDADYLRALNDAGVHTLADLLDIDPDLMDSELTRRGISSDLVDRWQSQVWLKIAIPELTANDTLLLYFAGVSDPRLFDQWNDTELGDRIRRTLANPAYGRSFDASRYQGDRFSNWRNSFDRNRSFWRNHQRYLRRNRQRRRWTPEADQVNASRQPSQRVDSSRERDFNPRSNSERSTYDRDSGNHRGGDYAQREMPTNDNERDSRGERQPSENRENQNSRFADPRSRHIFPAETNPSASRSAASEDHSNRTDKTSSKSELKFYLSLDDDLEAAPSIGPSSAERFANIDIKTVRDFVNGNAEQMHRNLKYKRIKLDDIIQWQHQARLVCRIPNLRGHDAQLLVACDITDPENVADMEPQELFSIIGPFSETKDGQKIIRSGKQPDLDEIKDWINWAKDTRQLQAA